MKNTTQTTWNAEAFVKQFEIALGLTTRAILIALNQKESMTPEARAAYEYILNSREGFGGSSGFRHNIRAK